jgi:hypothetical protein
MKYFILPFFIIIFFNACAQRFTNETINKEKIQKKIHTLSELLIKNSPKIDKNEANDLSKNAIYYSMYLANEYEVTTTPLIHNTLIHLNIKKRGYCYDYANDLKKFLKKRAYKSFKIIKIVSSRNKYFEHNSLAITRDDISFEDSIILDAWRDAGDLYFSKIKDDTKYNWEIR